jgi:Tfp pilus assembly protein PilP
VVSARKTGVKWIAVAGLALIVGVGCQGETSDPEKAEIGAERAAATNRIKNKSSSAGGAKAKTKARSSGGVMQKADLAFIYDRTGKRDPFRSFEWERPDASQSAIRTPLEQFDVNQLDLVGVVWKTGNARALIHDPAGQGYIIGEGARIGKNEGRVIEIGDNRVVVKETYVDYLGQKTTKDVEMRIRRSEGG